jgi:hypothetical protein
MLLLALSFFLVTIDSDSESTAEELAGVLSLGVGFVEVLDSASSASSNPNESFPFAATFRFFFDESRGVEALYLENQLYFLGELAQEHSPVLRRACSRCNIGGRAVLALKGFCASLAEVVKVNEAHSLLLEKIFGCRSLRCEARISRSSATRSFVGGRSKSVHIERMTGLSVKT